MGPYLWPKSSPVDMSLKNIDYHICIIAIRVTPEGLVPEDLEVEVIRNFGAVLIGDGIGRGTIERLAALHLVLHCGRPHGTTQDNSRPR